MVKIFGKRNQVNAPPNFVVVCIFVFQVLMESEKGLLQWWVWGLSGCVMGVCVYLDLRFDPKEVRPLYGHVQLCDMRTYWGVTKLLKKKLKVRLLIESVCEKKNQNENEEMIFSMILANQYFKHFQVSTFE